MVQQQRPQQPMMQQQRMQTAPQGMVGNAQQMYKSYGMARNPQPNQAQVYQPQPQAGIVVQGQEPLTAHMLAQAMPQVCCLSFFTLDHLCPPALVVTKF
jgi:hypothetical protein